MHKAGDPETTILQVEHIWVEYLPEMKIQFYVSIYVTFEIPRLIIIFSLPSLSFND